MKKARAKSETKVKADTKASTKASTAQTATKPRTKGASKARSASGKQMDPDKRTAAESKALQGVKDRADEGHIAAGRTPPAQENAGRSKGAARIVDESIRNYPVVTEDEKLL